MARVIMDGVLPAWIHPDVIKELADGALLRAGVPVAAVLIECRGDTVKLAAGDASGARICWECGRELSLPLHARTYRWPGGRNLKFLFCDRHPSGSWAARPS